MIYNRVFDARTALEPTYPATLPSTGDSPAFDALLKTNDRSVRRDSPVDQDSRDSKSDVCSNDLAILHAPPGYVSPTLVLSTPYHPLSLITATDCSSLDHVTKACTTMSRLLR
jgi:hypothetical protein